MKAKLISIVCIAAISSAVLVQAKQSKPGDSIKFRQSGMMFMRWNMGKIKKQVVKQPETYDRQQVLDAAKVVAAIANSGMDSLFSPETATGTGWKETRVKPEYFEQPEKARERYLDFVKEANELVDVAGTGDVVRIKGKFEKVFDACRSCHKRYRAKK